MANDNELEEIEEYIRKKTGQTKEQFDAAQNKIETYLSELKKLVKNVADNIDIDLTTIDFLTCISMMNAFLHTTLRKFLPEEMIVKLTVDYSNCVNSDKKSDLH